MATKKPKKYANPLTMEAVEIQEPATDMQAPAEDLEKTWNDLMRADPGKIEPLRREPRKIPDGMNKYNSTNEWLMLILESLYRIEAKLGA